MAALLLVGKIMPPTPQHVSTRLFFLSHCQIADPVLTWSFSQCARAKQNVLVGSNISAPWTASQLYGQCKHVPTLEKNIIRVNTAEHKSNCSG